VSCINSLIQQLYMIPSFRKGILESEFITEDTHKSSLYYLRLLFGRLKENKRDYYDALYLCSSIKDREGNSLPIYNESDPDELFSLLMDQLAIDLESTNNSKLIDEVFRGSFSSEVICRDCPHRYEVREEFISLSFQTKRKKDLIEALNEFTKTETLAGNKSYYCTKCNTKVHAKARISLVVLPNVLVVSLKELPSSLQTK